MAKPPFPKMTSQSLCAVFLSPCFFRCFALRQSGQTKRLQDVLPRCIKERYRERPFFASSVFILYPFYQIVNTIIGTNYKCNIFVTKGRLTPCSKGCVPFLERPKSVLSLHILCNSKTAKSNQKNIPLFFDTPCPVP